MLKETKRQKGREIKLLKSQKAQSRRPPKGASWEMGKKIGKRPTGPAVSVQEGDRLSGRVIAGEGASRTKGGSEGH